jgi:hypothetical protein
MSPMVKFKSETGAKSPSELPPIACKFRYGIRVVMKIGSSYFNKGRKREAEGSGRGGWSAEAQEPS